MNLKTESASDILIVTPTADRIDASNYENFRDHMQTIMEGNCKVLLDLGEVEFMDSSAMGVVLYCARETAVDQGVLKICSPSEAVRVAFDLIRIDRMVDVLETRADALKSFTS